MELLCWFDFMLVIAICGLFSYVVSNMDHFLVETCVVNYFLLACQARDDCQTSNKVSLITKLLILR